MVTGRKSNLPGSQIALFFFPLPGILGSSACQECITSAGLAACEKGSGVGENRGSQSPIYQVTSV
jgi:hypothetical protein